MSVDDFLIDVLGSVVSSRVGVDPGRTTARNGHYVGSMDRLYQLVRVELDLRREWAPFGFPQSWQELSEALRELRTRLIREGWTVDLSRSSVSLTVPSHVEPPEGPRSLPAPTPGTLPERALQKLLEAAEREGVQWGRDIHGRPAIMNADSLSKPLLNRIRDNWSNLVVLISLENDTNA